APRQRCAVESPELASRNFSVRSLGTVLIENIEKHEAVGADLRFFGHGMHAVTMHPSDSFRRRSHRHAPPCASPFPLRDVSAFPASFVPWPDYGQHAADCN